MKRIHKSENIEVSIASIEHNESGLCRVWEKILIRSILFSQLFSSMPVPAFWIRNTDGFTFRVRGRLEMKIRPIVLHYQCIASNDEPRRYTFLFWKQVWNVMYHTNRYSLSIIHYLLTKKQQAKYTCLYHVACGTVIAVLILGFVLPLYLKTITIWVKETRKNTLKHTRLLPFALAVQNAKANVSTRIHQDDPCYVVLAKGGFKQFSSNFVRQRKNMFAWLCLFWRKRSRQ